MADEEQETEETIEDVTTTKRRLSISAPGWSQIWEKIEKHGWPLALFVVGLAVAGKLFLSKDEFIQTKLLEVLDRQAGATSTQTELARQQLSADQAQTLAITTAAEQQASALEALGDQNAETMSGVEEELDDLTDTQRATAKELEFMRIQIYGEPNETADSEEEPDNGGN